MWIMSVKNHFVGNFECSGVFCSIDITKLSNYINCPEYIHTLRLRTYSYTVWPITDAYIRMLHWQDFLYRPDKLYSYTIEYALQ